MTSVSAYEDAFTINASTTPGAVGVQIDAADLPRGRYRIDAYTILNAATTPNAQNLLSVQVGDGDPVRMLSFNAVQSSSAFQPHTPFTIWADLDGTQDVAITAAAAETATNVQTFSLVLVATRIPYGTSG